MNNINIQPQIKDVIEKKELEYKKSVEIYKKKQKENDKKNDVLCIKMRQLMIEEIIKYVNENKEEIINSFDSNKKVKINIKLQNLWKDLFPQIYKRDLYVKSWESSFPKRSFSNTNPIDFDVSKKFYDIMGKYLINQKIFLDEKVFRNCYITFEKGYIKYCSDCWYDGEVYETYEIVVNMYYNDSYCSIM
jgi:hypothetical protein